MQIIRVGILSVFILSQFFGLSIVHATSATMVISQLQTGGSGSGTAGQEFIELYNNGSTDINITDWRITYSSASDISQSTVYQFATSGTQTALWLKAKSYVTVVSPDFKTATGIAGDGVFAYTNGMAQPAGHVRLFNNANNEIDKVAWGATTVMPPETTTVAPASGKVLQRNGSGTLQDTDNDSADFTVATPAMHVTTTGIYEVVTVVDVCPNQPDIQQTMPAGYLADGQGNCQPDSCLNIVGLQQNVPDHYDSDAAGNCTEHDECDNVPDIQVAIPANMIQEGTGCIWDVVPLVLTELLPNATGSDTGSEFIEIYNPSDRVADLALYSLRIGADGQKVVAFPDDATIAPGEYRSFSDQQLKLTLVNTSDRVVLVDVAGSKHSDSGVYDSPPDGQSWALIASVWQYTNQPTPGAANSLSVIEMPQTTGDPTDGVAVCPAGKYRNPLTNRCRTIVTDASVLGVCDEGQYRNPETGRCRKIVATITSPCTDGQYRSEETNRCRNIVTASTQKPCKDNQYRSEETGRCRNAAAPSVPDAAFAVQPVKEGAAAFVGWWALGGVGLFAVGYGAWEWRYEIRRFVGQIVSRFSVRR